MKEITLPSQYSTTHFITNGFILHTPESPEGILLNEYIDSLVIQSLDKLKEKK